MAIPGSNRRWNEKVVVFLRERKLGAGQLRIQSTTCAELEKVVEICDRVILCGLSFGLIHTRMGSVASLSKRIWRDQSRPVVCGNSNLGSEYPISHVQR